jgi:ABC-type nickel/cobalt efflux system permease component RcnA
MTQNEEELIQLKELYEELWHDAKTLAKDMKRSIFMYLYSALVTFAVAVLGFTYSAVYWAGLLNGNTSVLNYIGAIIEPVSSVMITIFGITLLRWYFRIKKRYSRLTEIEKSS